jgi:hypothetical protein
MTAFSGRLMRATRRVSICALAAATLLCASCNFFRPRSNPQFSQSDVVAQTDSQDQFALSPDGTLAAHLGTGIWPTKHFDGKTLQFFSVNPAKQVASIQLSNDLDRHPGIFSRDQLQFCDHGKYLLALEDSANVDVVDTNQFQLRTAISLKAAEEAIRAEALKKPKGDLYGPGYLTFAACAANGPLAAFFVGNQAIHLGNIKVFNLETGSEIPGFDGLGSPEELAGLAVAPDGSSIALLNGVVLPITGSFDTGKDTVTVIDVASHSIARRFFVESEAMFHYDPIAYAGDHALVIQLNQFRPYRPGTVMGAEGDESSVHFYDIATGSEIRAITAPKANRFSMLGVSADGKVVLTYAEKWRHCIFCKRYSNEYTVSDARFTLWDRNTGAVIAEDPAVRLVHQSCPWLMIMGSCTPSDEAPDLALDQSGNAVIASWITGDQPLSVFTLRQKGIDKNGEDSR